MDIQAKVVQKNGAEGKRLPAVASECNVTGGKNPKRYGLVEESILVFLGCHVPFTALCSPQAEH